METQMDTPMRDLIEIIHFTENVSTKIHGLLDEAEIYRTVKEEFAKSKRYSATIFLLTADGSKLRIVETSMSPGRLKAAEKAAGLRTNEYKLELNKLSIFSQVAREGKTVQANVSDLLNEMFPRPLAYLISKIMGYEKRPFIATPLKRHGKIIGAFAMSSTELAEFITPSVRNLAQHISTALELANEHVERERIEKELRESEERFRELFENAYDLIFTLDLNGNFTSANNAALKVSGYTAEEIAKMNIAQILPPEVLQAAKMRIARIARGETLGPYEYEFIKKDGSRAIIELSSRAILAEGKSVGIHCIARDVTERKKAEEELAHERDLLHALMDNIPDTIYFKDTASRFMRINRAHAKILGLNDPKEAIGKTDFDFSDEEFAREAYEDEQRIIRTGKPLVGKIERPKRPHVQFRWVSATKVPIMDKEGRITGIVGISRDITERKQAEEALRESEEKYRSLVELAPDSIMTFDLKGVITSCNTASARLSGYSRDELVGKHFSKIGAIRARDIPKYLKMLPSTLRGKVPEPFEVIWQHKNGALHFGEVHVSLMKENGKTIGAQAIMRDITERKDMEEDLRESEERLRQLIEYAPDGIYINDLHGNFIDGNKQAEKLTGYKKEELIGKSMLEAGLLPKSYLPKAVKALAKNALGQKTGPDEFELIRKDGRRVSVEISTFPVKSGGKVEVMGIARDITERKRIEEKLKEYTENLEKIVEERTRKLKEVERLAAIGETAAMVGHDLRNPLQVLINTVYLGKETVKSMPSPCRELAEEKGVVELFGTVGGQVEYMNKIVSDLQDFARTLKPEPVETSLHQLINDTLSTIRVPENVKVSMMIEEDFPKLRIDPAMMKRVFTNLVTNALQAMPDGGQLTIRASRTEEAISISVQDTGVGIPEENLDKLFQPLFTTKSKGTGFGLPVCKRIVEAHDGSITVESKVGRGSTFTVKIPLRKEVN